MPSPATSPSLIDQQFAGGGMISALPAARLTSLTPPSLTPASTATEATSPALLVPALLSTDYFNLFNEMVVLLRMLPRLPEMLEDVQAWRYQSYVDYFRASSLGFACATILTYQAMSPFKRQDFDQLVDEMRDVVAEAQTVLPQTKSQLPTEIWAMRANAYADTLQDLVAFGSALIQGR